MRFNFSAIVVLTVVALSFPTCSSDNDPEDECERDYDCPEGQVCDSSCWVAHNCYEEYYVPCYMECQSPSDVCYDFILPCGQGEYCDTTTYAGRCHWCEPCRYDDFCGPWCDDCTVYPSNKVCIWNPDDGGYCGCREDLDCAENQRCVDRKCWLDGHEVDCRDGIDEDEDGLTDCLDTDDCALQPCGIGERCEDGSCRICDIPCTTDADCAGCGRLDSCNTELGCCAFSTDSECPWP